MGEVKGAPSGVEQRGHRVVGVQGNADTQRRVRRFIRERGGLRAAEAAMGRGIGRWSLATVAAGGRVRIATLEMICSRLDELEGAR